MFTCFGDIIKSPEAPVVLSAFTSGLGEDAGTGYADTPSV